MSKIKSRKFLTLILSLICAVLLGVTVGLFSGTVGGKTANAKVHESSDILIDELALNTAGTTDANGNVFSGENLAKLYDAISGTNYTGSGTLEKVKDILNNNGTAKLGSGVSTKALNAADFRTRLGKDIYVTLGGIEWEVVYLTTNRSGEIILDLYQATNSSNSEFSYGGYTVYNSNAYSNVGNVYGTSYMRSVTLGNGGVYYEYASGGSTSAGTSKTPTAAQLSSSAYAKFVSGGFSSYLDTPADVDYQEKEGWPELNGQTGPNATYYNLINDAYGYPSVENYAASTNNTNLTDRDSVGGASGARVPSNHKIGYEAWQNDKVWLPSQTETGASPINGLWGLNNKQRANITSSLGQTNLSTGSVQNAYTWLRTGGSDAADCRYLLPNGTVSSDNHATSSAKLAVRPAIHFNLTRANAAADEIRVPEPQNVSAEYDGTSMWLDKLETVKDSSGNFKYSWINSSLHNNTSIVSVSSISYTSKDILGANLATSTVTSSDVLSAGVYTVTLNIASGQTDYCWRDGSTGDKTFTITVNQKTVPYTLQIKKGGNAVTSVSYGDTFTGELSQSVISAAQLPTMNYELKYSGTGTTTYPENSAAPTNAGTYSLAFKPIADPANVGMNMPCNYKFTGSSAAFTISPKELKVPTITGSQEYTGSALSFVLSDFGNGQNIKVDSVTGANGNTATGAGGAAWTDTSDTFEATKVDTYTVALSLRDDKNYCWTVGDNQSKNVTFEVTQKELLSSQPVSSKVNGIGGAEWGFGESGVTVTITDDRISGENITLFCYYDVAGGTNKSNSLTAVTTGNTSVITMPNNIPVGKYTLTVELKDASGDNANYKTTANNTLDFEITSGKIDPKSYGWVYTKDSAAGAAIANGGKLPFALKSGSTEDGAKYEVSIQIPASHTSVQIDTSKYVNGYASRSSDKVGTYSTTVALISTDPTFMFEDASGNKTTTTDVTLNWEIEKGTFDLSGVKWEYTTDGTNWADYDSANHPQYNNGNYITVRIKSSTLPTGLSLDSLYAGNEEYDVGNYEAKIAVSDFVFNSTNFNDPDVNSLTLNWEIAKKNLYTRFKNVKHTYSNSNGSGTVIVKELDVAAEYAGYITYKYYDISDGTEVTLEDIKNAVDPTSEKKYKVEAYIDPALAANFAVDDGGKIPSDTFVTGSKNKLATATLDGNDGSAAITAEYDGNAHFDKSLIKITGDDGINVTDFTVTYYKGNAPVEGNALSDGKLPTEAGEYCVEIVLGSTAEKKYILATDRFTLKIEPKKVALPEIGAMQFNGSEQSIASILGGSYAEYEDIIQLSNDLQKRNVGTYTTVLTITNPNYKWAQPSVQPAKLSLTDGEITLTDDVTAQCSWSIAPMVVNTSNLWNKSKDGATLNLPDNIKAFVDAGTLEVGYKYYDAAGQFVESPELKGGKSFKVEAVFAGTDAELGNIVFEKSNGTLGAVSEGIDYTVPQSGASAFFGNTLTWAKNNWWILVAIAAALIFLIILICIIAHRRKTKEIREEKKAQKEEEKRRKEAERELEKAKAEAELAKMRAAAGLGAGAAGMALAAQQQPQQAQQQQMPQQQQMQPMQQQQPQYPQYPQYMPQQQYGDPVMINELARLKAENEMRLKVELERARAEAERAKAEAEIARRSGMTPQYFNAQGLKDGEQGSIPMDVLGALVVSALKNMAGNGGLPKLEEPKPVLSQSTDETVISTPTVYPPDAVITTTTTVDTTKGKPAKENISRDGERSFDIDGFYDTFDVDKK